MSLINKMLQDLEERRSESQVAGVMHTQVRATPEPRRTHFAWWLVLVLTLILLGVISWIWAIRANPAAVPTVQAPQILLKPERGSEIPPALKIDAAEEKTAILPASAIAAAPAIQEDGAAKGRNTAAFDLRTQSDAPPGSSVPPMPRPASAGTPGQASLPAEATGNTTPASSPTATLAPASAAESSPAQATLAKPLAAAIVKSNVADFQLQKPEKSTSTEFDIPSNVTKQIKEPSPSQRAEEEYRRATVLLNQGKNNEAIAALEKSLQLDSQHSVARQTLAGLLHEEKRHNDAMRVLQLGLDLDKNHPALAMMLSRLQIDKGDLRAAVETLQRTLPYAVERADYHAFFAALLQREGRHKEAAEHYLIALGKSPQNGLWWMGIGISLQADNRLSDARDAFGRAKASNNLSPELLAFVEQKLSQLRQ